MCEPATIMLVVSAATAAVSAVNQHKMASRTDDAARQAQSDAGAALATNMHQQDAAATDNMVERSKQAMAESGHISAIFADSGLTGNSQDRIASIAEGEAHTDLTTLERNRAEHSNQGAQEAAAIRARAQAQMNSVQRSSTLGTGLQIVGAGLNAYSQGVGKK